MFDGRGYRIYIMKQLRKRFLASLLFLAVLVILGAGGITYYVKNKENAHSVVPQENSSISNGGKQVASPSNESTNLAMRAEYIKGQIKKYKEWSGGHSPVPQRAVTANTFEKVKQEISQEDSAALMILLQDDAGDIRSIAASLLGCVDPDAQSEIEKLLAAEKSIERQYRFREALIVINSIRAGRTSCK